MAENYKVWDQNDRYQLALEMAFRSIEARYRDSQRHYQNKTGPISDWHRGRCTAFDCAMGELKHALEQFNLPGVVHED